MIDKSDAHRRSQISTSDFIEGSSKDILQHKQRPSSSTEIHGTPFSTSQEIYRPILFKPERMPYQSQTGSQTRGSMDAEFLNMLKEKRKRAIFIVQGIMEHLMAFCPCCFVLKGSKIDKGHRYFSDCRELVSIKESINGTEWIDLRKNIKLPYGHCWKCGIPNYGYNLAYHANGHDKGVPCPFSDFIAL